MQFRSNPLRKLTFHFQRQDGVGTPTSKSEADRSFPAKVKLLKTLKKYLSKWDKESSSKYHGIRLLLKKKKRWSIFPLKIHTLNKNQVKIRDPYHKEEIITYQRPNINCLSRMIWTQIYFIECLT